MNERRNEIETMQNLIDEKQNKREKIRERAKGVIDNACIPVRRTFNIS